MNSVDWYAVRVCCRLPVNHITAFNVRGPFRALFCFDISVLATSSGSAVRFRLIISMSRLAGAMIVIEDFIKCEESNAPNYKSYHVTTQHSQNNKQKRSTIEENEKTFNWHRGGELSPRMPFTMMCGAHTEEMLSPLVRTEALSPSNSPCTL